MNELEFKNLIKKDKYQIFLFSSSIPFPFNFLFHTWIVTNNKGKINRWEVWQNSNIAKNSVGYVNINLYPPWMGLRIYGVGKISKSSDNILRYKSKLLGSLEGRKGSLAEKMVNFIEKYSYSYIYFNEYHYFPGPNSNTFTEWILNKFPKSGLKLPWNAVGKNFKKRI